MSAEIDAHLEEQVDDLVAGGISREEAIYTARRKFGNVALTKEMGRDVWRWRRTEDLLFDVRYGLRTLLRSRSFAVTALLTVALGIACNTAMFSIINAWLLRPLPLKDPERLVSVWRTAASNPHEPAYFDLYRDYLIWSSTNHTLESLAGMFPQEYTITGEGEPRQIHGAIATWNLFATAGVSAEAGRLFSPEDVRGEQSCVISYSFWQSQFGGSRGVVGRFIELNGNSYRVLGVLPAKFSLRVLDRPFETDTWTLITADDRNHQSTSTAPISVIGRLRPGVTRAQAEAELNSIQRELNNRFADEPHESGVLAADLQRDNTRTLRSSLLLLTCAVAVLLLIACANVGSLVLGRNSDRTREFAVRLALGCSVGRLLRQLTTEVVLLFVCGGVLGLGLATALIWVFVAANPFGVLPPGGISIDATVLAMTAAVIFVTALLFGSVPMMQVLRRINVDVLRVRTSTSSHEHLRSRMLFVVAEIALSFVLLVSAVLFVLSYARLASAPRGFESRSVYVGELALPLSRYPKVDRQAQFVDALLSKLRGWTAIRAVGVSTTWPFQANGLNPIEVKGRPVQRDHETRAFTFNASRDYFAALGVALLQGRDFLETDGPGSPQVAVINQAMARKAFPGDDPIGKQIRTGTIDNRENSAPWLTVIGVIGNTPSMRYNHTDWETEPAIYTSFLQRRDPKGAVQSFETQTIYVFLQADNFQTAALAAAAHDIDPLIPVPPLRTTGQIVSELQAQPRLRAWVLGSFACLTMLLAAIGVYGVMTQFVEQRRKEIGIRIALGATTDQVVRLIIRRSTVLIFCGVVIGGVAALAASRILRGFLYQVSPFSPWIFVVVLATLVMIAVAASYLPAQRAARIDPNITLRYE